jgi:PTH1 family peptidyl-tRNA hydrolase
MFEGGWVLHLLVFLGNPGSEYRLNRHNVGFLMGEWITGKRVEDLEFSKKFEAYTLRITLNSVDFLCLYPQTFMNHSGRSVASALRYLKLEAKQMTVIYDELDVEFSKVKVRMDGGHGGHNGLRSILAECGAEDFSRIKVGISRPPKEWGHEGVSRWVLSNFSAEELKVLENDTCTIVKDRVFSIIRSLGL